MKSLWSKIKSKFNEIVGNQPMPKTENYDYHNDGDAAYTRVQHCHNGLLDDSGLSVNQIEDCWRDKEIHDTGMLKTGPSEPAMIVSSREAKPIGEAEPIEEGELIAKVKKSKKKSSKKSQPKKASKATKNSKKKKS